MNRSLPLFAVLLGMICALPLASAQQQLRYQWKAGAEYQMVTKSKQAQKMGEMSNQVETTMYTKRVVKSVDEKGVATVEETITRMVLGLTMAMQPQIVIDTDKKEANDNPMAQMMEGQVKGMVGKVITHRIDSRGKILETKMPEMEGPAGGQVKQMAAQTGLELPEKPQKVGDSWENKQDVSQQGMNLVITNTYTYQGPAKEGASQHKISYKMDVASKADPNNPAQATFKTKESKGEVLFDTASGQVVKNTSSAKMAANVNGMDMEIDIATTVTIKQTKGGAVISKPGE